MPPEGFRCRRCGKCCQVFDLDATKADCMRWQSEDRRDILRWVDLFFVTEVHGMQKVVFAELDDDLVLDFGVNPVTGELTDRCPFLRKLPGKPVYKCRIYDTRPEHCRLFPASRESALKIGCPGFDEQQQFEEALWPNEAHLRA